MHLDRLVTVLEAVAIAGGPVSATELHKITGLPRPTCYRMLQMLSDHRLLDSRDSKSKFVIGDRLLRIAALAQTDASLCDVISPVLRNSADEFGEAVFFSRLGKNGVKIIHVETPTDQSISYIHPGLGFRPVHACSCAKAIVAFADDAFRETILNGPMKSYTDKTRTNKKALREEFEKIREQGFAECVEEIEVGVSSIAAPVRLANAGTVFSLGTIGPIRRFTAKNRRPLGKQLIEKTVELSSAIRKNSSIIREID